jgi:uncharacterized membrane protein YfcA
MPSEAQVLLVLAGLAAGFINTLAGGGSLLTLPALIFLGLDAQVANGTNRIAVLVQNATAVVGFARQGWMPGRLLFAVLPPALLGALVGARVAVEVPEPHLRIILAGVLVMALPAVFLPEGGSGRAGLVAGGDRPGVGQAEPEEGGGGGRGDAHGDGRGTSVQPRPRMSPWMVAAFLAIGFYGGFIQAGVGFLILGALVPFGLDLLRANALKVAIVLAHTAIALPVFVARGQVEWTSGLLLAAGTMAGAWIGTHFAVRGGARSVRWVLAGAVVVSAAHLLGLWSWLSAWLSGRFHD